MKGGDGREKRMKRREVERDSSSDINISILFSELLTWIAISIIIIHTLHQRTFRMIQTVQLADNNDY